MIPAPWTVPSRPATRRRLAFAGEVLFWTGGLGLVVVVLLPIRADLDKAHVALVLLLVVLGASARGGRTLGAITSVTSFLAFNAFFLPPYGTLRLADPLDWVVLATFLVTSLVAAELLHRQREATRRAQAETLKDAVLLSVSHDLRTPLTTIKALAHELRPLGDERTQVIEEQADRLGRYLADLLDLSRLNAGTLPLRREVNVLDDLLGAVMDETAARWPDRPVHVHTAPAGAMLAGTFDLAWSVRIVTNLLENALKYSPPGAPVDIEATRAGGDGAPIVVSVLDRGAGIPADEAERIFAPFYRAPSAAPDSGSAGLGLAIGRRVAELQGGSLRLAARPGGGTVFSLTLPGAQIEGTAGSL